MSWEIVLTPQARRMLGAVRDRRERALLIKPIDALGGDAEKQGKALLGELAGLRSVRAVGQRHRILFRVVRQRAEVISIALGRRRVGSASEIYALARKLIKLGLAE